MLYYFDRILFFPVRCWNLCMHLSALVSCYCVHLFIFWHINSRDLFIPFPWNKRLLVHVAGAIVDGISFKYAHTRISCWKCASWHVEGDACKAAVYCWNHWNDSCLLKNLFCIYCIILLVLFNTFSSWWNLGLSGGWAFLTWSQPMHFGPWNNENRPNRPIGLKASPGL